MFLLNEYGHVVFSPDEGGGGAADQETDDNDQTSDAGGEPSGDETEEEELSDFETQLKTDYPELYKMYGTHVAGLLSALDKERAGNKQGKKAAARLAELEKAEEERARAQRTELENAQTDLTKATGQATALSARVETLTLENTILRMAGEVEFNDPADAIKFLDRESIDMADESTIQAAVKKLAKEKPYLLKQESNEDDDDHKLGSHTVDHGKGKSETQTKKDAKQAEIRKNQPKVRI